MGKVWDGGLSDRDGDQDLGGNGGLICLWYIFCGKLMTYIPNTYKQAYSCD